MRVTVKGQVTIPKHIRDHLGIGPGSEVEIVPDGAAARLVTVADGREQDRLQRFRRSLARMAGTIETHGMDGKDYVDHLRGPREDLDLD